MTTAGLAYAQYTGYSFNIDAALRFVPLATPTDPAAGKTNIYITSDGTKLVIQHKEAGGTMRYKYLDLDGTGVTWAYSATAP